MRLVGLVLCGIALSACSAIPRLSEAPDPGNRFSLESNPPGAEARITSGATCRTPCTLPVKVSDYNVTFALADYAPRFVPIRVSIKREHWYSPPVTYVDPNPVVVQLERVMGPQTVKKPSYTGD
jgi:PEGA domain